MIRGKIDWRLCAVSGAVVAGCTLSLFGCARLPYTVQTVHEDQRAIVTLQQEVEPARYSHPVQISPQDLGAILRSFSFREKQKLPLRWFAEEAPPKRVFRQDELEVLTPYLAEALQKAGPEERIHFTVLAPGMNPALERDTTDGWIAVRGPYFHLTLEHYHGQFSIRKEEMWDLRYPAIPPEPGTFLLYFEPNRFWSTDPAANERGVLYRDFLKSAIVPGGK
ncbi:MAG: hypothetical protein FJ245_09460 [Nitrospira sp.]|nr:hypothetical protein [Nitrospira sp.]